MNKISYTVLICLTMLLIVIVKLDVKAQNLVGYNDWLKEQISYLEKMKSSSIEKINNYQSAIQKCDKTIKKSQDIISQAQQQNNRQAEIVANDALIKAYDAKRKNLDLLVYEKFNLNLIEKKLNEFGNLLKGMDSSKNLIETDCDKLALQLERDKLALKNFMKTIKMTEDGREEWTKEGEDAMKEAGMTLLKFFAGELANHLTARDGQIKLIKKEIEKLKIKKAQELANNKYLIDKIDGKIKNAEDLFQKLLVKKPTDLILKADNMSETIKSQVELSQSIVEQGDKQIIEVLSDPEIKSKLWEMNSTFVELLHDYEFEINASKKFFKTVSPITSRITTLRDLIYSVTKVSLSSDLVAQLSEVAEQELKAVDSLKKQIMRTTEKLNDCRKKTKK